MAIREDYNTLVERLEPAPEEFRRFSCGILFDLGTLEKAAEIWERAIGIADVYTQLSARVYHHPAPLSPSPSPVAIEVFQFHQRLVMQTFDDFVAKRKNALAQGSRDLIALLVDKPVQVLDPNSPTRYLWGHAKRIYPATGFNTLIHSQGMSFSVTAQVLPTEGGGTRDAVVNRKCYYLSQ